MFCPKCGGENGDDIAFCRACGENLKIISQVLKGHAPLEFVSKLDDVISRKNERLWRDSIWWGVWGTILAVGSLIFGPIAFVSQITWLQNLVTILLPLVLFVFAGREYLAYRRSFETGNYAPSGAPEPLLPAADQSSSAPDESRAAAPIYCTSCGEKNSAAMRFCKSCGSGLTFGPTGLAKYLPAAMVDHLDRRIAANEEIRLPHKTLGRIALVGGFFVLNAIFQGFAGNIQTMFLNVFCGLSTLLINGWDYLTYRRTSPAVEDRAPGFLHDLGLYFSKPERRTKVVGGLIVISILNTGVLWIFDERAYTVAFVSVIAAAAGFALEFRSFRWGLQEGRRRLAERPAANTLEPRDIAQPEVLMRELKSSLGDGEPLLTDTEDIRPLAQFGMTEETTKPLPARMGALEEKVATTKKLDAE